MQDHGPQALNKLFVYPTNDGMYCLANSDARMPQTSSCANHKYTQIYNYFGKDFLDFHKKGQKINPCHMASPTHQHPSKVKEMNHWDS